MYNTTTTITMQANLLSWMQEEVDCPSLLGDFEPDKTPRIARFVELSVAGRGGGGGSILIGAGEYGREGLTADEHAEAISYATVFNAAGML